MTCMAGIYRTQSGWRGILPLVCSEFSGFYTQCPKEAECCPGFMFPRYRSYRNNESYLCFYLSMPGREKGAWPLESAHGLAKYFMSTQVQGKQREIQHNEIVYILGLPFCRWKSGWLCLLKAWGMQRLKGWEQLPLFFVMWDGLILFGLIYPWGGFGRHWSRNLCGKDSHIIKNKFVVY